MRLTTAILVSLLVPHLCVAALEPSEVTIRGKLLMSTCETHVPGSVSFGTHAHTAYSRDPLAGAILYYGSPVTGPLLLNCSPDEKVNLRITSHIKAEGTVGVFLGLKPNLTSETGEEGSTGYTYALTANADGSAFITHYGRGMDEPTLATPDGFVPYMAAVMFGGSGGTASLIGSYSGTLEMTFDYS
jgi:hypothetical protein